MNILEEIEEYMQQGLTEEQTAEIFDRVRNQQDYYDDGFDDERDRLIKSIEEELM